MDASVWIAGMGFAATLLGAWLGPRWQRKAEIEIRLVEARVEVYGRCVETLSEYRRATYNRVKARLDKRTEEERERLRQDAYQANARARAATGEAAIVSGSPGVAQLLEGVRQDIGEFNGAADKDALKGLAEALDRTLKEALDQAQLVLTARPSDSRRTFWKRGDTEPSRGRDTGRPERPVGSAE